MPEEIGAYEAKTHLAALLERVARGERFTITKHGRRRESLASFAQRQHVRDFEMPYGWNGRCFDGKTLQHPIGGGSRLILEAPCKGHGSIEHDFRHLLPSLISCLTGTSKVCPSRNALSRSAASRRRSGAVRSIGTRCAIGRPCLVIVNRSPRATRSSRAARWVLAA